MAINSLKRGVLNYSFTFDTFDINEGVERL